MNEILDALTKVSNFEDQVLVGEDRIQDNVDVALKVLNASKEANLGPNATQVVDALILIAQKLKQIVGKTNATNPVA